MPLRPTVRTVLHIYRPVSCTLDRQPAYVHLAELERTSKTSANRSAEATRRPAALAVYSLRLGRPFFTSCACSDRRLQNDFQAAAQVIWLFFCSCLLFRLPPAPFATLRYACCVRSVSAVPGALIVELVCPRQCDAARGRRRGGAGSQDCTVFHITRVPSADGRITLSKDTAQTLGTKAPFFDLAEMHALYPRPCSYIHLTIKM